MRPSRFASLLLGEDLAVANDGTVLLVGTTDTSDNEAALLARYRSQGRLDTTFGDEGIVGSAFGAFNEFGPAVALQRNGKIVVAGSAGDDLRGVEVRRGSVRRSGMRKPGAGSRWDFSVTSVGKPADAARAGLHHPLGSTRSDRDLPRNAVSTPLPQLPR